MAGRFPINVLRIALATFGLAAASIGAGEPADYRPYAPVVRPAVPGDAEGLKAATPVDEFLLEGLRAKGLGFSPPAERAMLLRRAKFDLVGLPPTPEEIERFVGDGRSDAYERLLDELLASPHYGERWGRHWLDVVRYADSSGYNADPVRPLAYKYRDYVIQAFNDDVPYDRFIREQIAGDELYPDQPRAWIAAGFLRLPPDESNASNILLARQDMLNDITAVVGSVFLGQSFGCAQCHDHKFDPITQVDYYRLQAFFAGIIPLDRAAVGTPEELAQYHERLRDWEQRTAALRDELRQLELPAKIAASGDKRIKFPAVVLTAIDTPSERRSALQHQLVFYSERQIPLTDEAIRKGLDAAQQARRTELQAALAREEAKRPPPPQALEAMTVADGDPLPSTHLLAGGSYNKPLEELLPGFPAYLNPDAVDPTISPPRAGTSGRRTALANWLADPHNPLVARVIVNRIWQGHFGRGLAANANDFGTQSAPPTHPALLDWLAAEFMEPTVDFGGANGNAAWSMKRLHKLIMLSHAYRQAGGVAVDDYRHFPRRRLEAEAIRDSLLAISGRLNPKLFGPSVQPELPPNFSTREAWAVSPDPAERRRRAVYILAKRNLPYPLLNDFDLPDMHESCARRAQTTIAPQALTLLNSQTVLDEARAFAGRLLREHPRGETAEIVPAAYRRAFGREPDGEEVGAAAQFLTRQESLLSELRQSAAPLPLDGFPKFLAPARGAAIVDFCHVLLNANEFLYVE